MTTTIELTKPQARRFLLAHQGLWPPRNLEGKSGILDYIRRVGCTQFDPLDIAGQNTELVLQSRVVDFRSAMLRELLYTDRLLLDGWDKNMSIYPVEDWPYFRRRREAAQVEIRSAQAVQAIAPQVKAKIETRGPLSSLELDFNQTVDWYWAPTRLARAALESLYYTGELIIHHKVHTRKVYDLAHRHIPAGLLNASEPNPTEGEYHDWYVKRRLGSFGLLWNRGNEGWVGIPAKSAQRAAALKRLIERGDVLEATVEGLEAPLYMRRQDYPHLESILASDGPPPQAAFIAPLDNLLWDRRLLKELFGFDYRWEVYKPVKERQYGYYVLPILYRDQFIGRFEPVREKRSSTLVIKNWWWEDSILPTDEMFPALVSCFECFLAYLGASQIQMDGKTVHQEQIPWLVHELIAKRKRSLS